MIADHALFSVEELEGFEKVASSIDGPILVIGATGFIGALFSKLLTDIRKDVLLVARSSRSWRTDALQLKGIISVDLSNKAKQTEFLEKMRPKTVFNLSASGAYQTQSDLAEMTKTNLELVESLGDWCAQHGATLVHAGSSSEYGSNSHQPSEDSAPLPNSLYGVTKYAGSSVLLHQSRTAGLIGAVLRLYSVFGPTEDPLRLFPTLIRNGENGLLPPFSPAEVSRDFVYFTDVVHAFLLAAVWAQKNRSFEVFNIGTGNESTMRDVADVARSEFEISGQPVFVDNLRRWDLVRWCANRARATEVLTWQPRVDLHVGLSRMRRWYQESGRHVLLDPELSIQKNRPPLQKISAVIACYRDELAIPDMYHRLRTTFAELGVDYEIIFVNDGSPDASTSRIVEISSNDPRVIGVVHSRNFGSQAAFLSGLRVATGDCCVIMDGDLQDPPEVIKQMYPHFLEGYEVVYGRRVTREASPLMNLSYRLFYRILKFMSPFSVPVDAGDFSLLARNVMEDLLSFDESELFLRTNRAYIGRRQFGVPYHRPERPYGRSTNSLLKNLQWAVKGVVSASRRPLSIMSAIGVLLVTITASALIAQLGVAIFLPDLAPPGVVTVILLVGFFGAINLLGISIIGEYVGRVLDEVRGRPRYIQSEMIRSGQIFSETYRDRRCL